MDQNESLGKTLRYLRGQRSQAEVARKAKVSAAALSEYERGRRAPRKKTLARLAGALEVSVDDLHGLELEVRAGKLSLEKDEDVFRHHIRELELEKMSNPEIRDVWEDLSLVFDHMRSASIKLLRMFLRSR